MDHFTTGLSWLFQWLVVSTIHVSVLICLILAIKALIRHRLAVRWHYWLWLLLLVRMLMPWAPQSSFSVFTLLSQAKTSIVSKRFTEVTPSAAVIDLTAKVRRDVTPRATVPSEGEEQVSFAGTTSQTAQTPASMPSLEIIGILSLLWLVVALALAIAALACNFKLWRIIRSQRPLTEGKILDALEDCKAEMGIQTILGVIVTDKVKSPALFGVVRPRLLLPEGIIETLTQEELRYVFLHELAHLKRRDIYLGWLMVILQVLHWFNPLVWLAFHRMRADRELACDGLVLSTMHADESERYGTTIVNLFRGFSQVQYVPGIAGILENKSQLKRRITMIARFKKGSYRWSTMAVVLLAILGCVFLTNAQGVSGPVNMSQTEIAELVKGAVLTISTCAEGDPRVKKSLASLQDLNEEATVTELTKFLDSDKDTVRRAAVYILWKGSFENIEPAVSKLQELCSHPKDLTRGMAAITLGATKIDSSFDTLCSMTLKDSSGYARRCAAYALGLMGRADAKETLEKALKDSDTLVRNNAEAALKMLSKSPMTKSFCPLVIATTPRNYANDVSSKLGKMSVTFDRPMANRSWSWVRWNYPYPKTKGKPSYDATKTTCTLSVTLEPGKAYFVRINAEPYMSFRSAQGTPAQPYVLVFATKDRNGKPTPIPENMLAKAKEINAIKPPQPYTQELTAEVTPNGALKFKTTIRAMNEGAKPITNTSFINSDFVNVARMHDEKGRPIEFTTVREGDHYRYHVTFNEPILPGKPMVYSSEGTMTGLIRPVPTSKDTYRYYMRHHPSAGRPTLRIETFLLPKGAELISTIPPNMKRSAKDGRIELHIEEVIPAGGSITTAFQYRLLEATSRKAVSDEDKREAENIAAEGWRLWQQRKLVEAEEKFKQAIKKDPTNGNAFQGLGWAQLNQGKKLNAKESFEKCIEINPSNAAALNGLGWIAYGQGKKDEAITWWKKAVTANPGTTASLSGLTKVYMERKDYGKAVKYYQMWLDVEPNSAEAKSGLAKAKSALQYR